MAHGKEELRQKFGALRKVRRDLFGGAEMIGYGAYGIVADHGDGTVSKILYGPNLASATVLERMKSVTDKEISFLLLLQQNPLTDAATPVLLSPPEPLEGPETDNFSAHYRMTKIPGATTPWDDGMPRLQPQQKLRTYFWQLGRALAQFHCVSKESGCAREVGTAAYPGEHVPHIPGADDRTNAALGKADSYLRTNMKAAVLHGDLHSDNVLADSDGSVTGILDFGMAGPHDNHVFDFRLIPAPNMLDFVAGYEAGCGAKIDTAIIRLTRLAATTENAIETWDDPHKQAASKKQFYRALNDVRDITGFIPPQCRR